MKIETIERGTIVLSEVFNPIFLKPPSGEILAVCMRDGGFELGINGNKYNCYSGQILPINKTKGELADYMDLNTLINNSDFKSVEIFKRLSSDSFGYYIFTFESNTICGVGWQTFFGTYSETKTYKLYKAK